MKRLSIIVPIYNVEPYLERCLRSLENQDIPRNDYEIICINDGSPDGSRGIVIRMQKEFNNIILIDQDNQGVSRARNNGIDIASGKYLVFIDPDDYVDPYSFDRILKNADEHEAQVSFLGFTVLNDNGIMRNEVFNEIYTGKIYPGTEAYYLTRGNGQIDPDRMWAVLLNTEFCNQYKLRYLPDVPYLEDGEILPVFFVLQNVAFLMDILFISGHHVAWDQPQTQSFFIQKVRQKDSCWQQVI